ncbi:MAG: hypothetical protein IPJ65_16385 [Archangiaceae bacterium]|nr:hypothetical protein [Archangiaceae bacterium]
MRAFVFALLPVMLFACGPDSATVVPATGDLEPDLSQAAIATDRADHACQVTLRHAERTSGPTGFETVCDSGGACWFVWQATIDVASTATAGKTVWVQWKSTDATTWSKKQAAKISGAPTGYQRYRVRLDSKTVGPGQSATSMQRARLDLLPYLKSSDGSRLFDHNRVVDDFGTYALVVNNQWSIAEDAEVCRPAGQAHADLDFRGDWSEVQHGPLLAGGTATLTYAITRLPQCRGSSGGRATWDITATVRFSPGGQQVEQSVRTFDAPNGVIDLSSARPLPFNFTVPPGAQSAEVWFVNTGLSCPPTWDSNDSANYRFPVEQKTPPAVGWVGNPASSTARDCEARPGIAEPIVLDGYIRERACSFVEMDVWAAGVTDQPRTELMVARAELSLDGQPLPARWLELRGQVGNDYRYRFDLPRDVLYYGSKWSRLDYVLAFSTDGVVWQRDVSRSVRRDPTWCNPAWGSCN